MDNFLETLKNLGSARLAMMVLTFFGLIVFFIFIAARSSAPSLTLLYANLSTSDSNEIASKLETANITYRLSEDGNQISVPQRDVGRARVLLAKEGLPHQGSLGYELFDKKQGFGTTSFEQNITQLRALEGELARTIGTIAQVRNARVHLVLPQRELFSRETQPASASVFINVRNSQQLGTEQIQAIQHLVSAAVPQLKSARVAIIDQNGALLARGEEEEGETAAARTGEEMRQKYESRMGRSIEDMLSRVVGYGKVRATVTAQLNFDTVSRNSESYNPDGQVIRSTQTISDQNDESGGQSGQVSVENNLPGLPGGAAGGGSSARSSRTEEVTNYEISKTVESVVRASGEVQKLSIAVLVDGTYETDTSVEKPADAGPDWTAPKKYIPRTQEELEKITALVKSSAGYDESRGDTVEVVSMPFADTDIFDVAAAAAANDNIMGFPKAEVLEMAQTLALSVVAVLIILLVLRPLATHLSNNAAANAAANAAVDPSAGFLPGQTQAQLTGPTNILPGYGAPSLGAEDGDNMIDVSAVEGKVKASSMQKINELVTNHPNETVAVIRQWISQEN